MFTRIAADHDTHCVSAQGKSNLYGLLESMADGRTLVIADGAAFGADMEKVYQFQKLHHNHVVLYLPESFEWLILKSGIIRNHRIPDILNNPSEHIESADYFSWEQFFTALLTELTNDYNYMRYSKQRLPDFYLQNENVQKFLDAMEE